MLFYMQMKQSWAHAFFISSYPPALITPGLGNEKLEQPQLPQSPLKLFN